MICLKPRLDPVTVALRLCLGAAALSCMQGALAAPSARVIVSYKEGAAAQVAAAVRSARGIVRHQVFGANAMAVEMTASGLARMARNRDVTRMEPDVRRYQLSLASASAAPYQTGQLMPFGISMVQADQLPDTQVGNRKVCIIDSGFDRKHEDLLANQVSGDSDPGGAGNWYQDENGHGTHVAGTIAAANNRGRGVIGVLPNGRVKLHIVKVFGADGKWAYSSTLASAANQCAKAGANVVNMSLGGGDPSSLERQAFANLEARGILVIGAAGNDGNTEVLYPAGYSSVVMVGAIDSSKTWAKFSQYNSKVELAGPGVGVLSTLPTDSGLMATLSVDGASFSPGILTGSPKASASAPLADFGLGDVVNPAMAGKVCLIKRGTFTFAEKVSNCQNSGGVGAIVYNNAPETFSGTLNGTVTTLPSLSVSGVDGEALMARLGQLASVAVATSSYGYKEGTSMAAPHVAAVAALVWSYYPSCNAKQMRATLVKSALDLGTPGRDHLYGYGLVQARAAYDRIALRGCGN